MKINPDIVKDFVPHDIDEYTTAFCKPAEGFEKLMVFLRNKKVVWAHRDCVVAEQARLPEKSKKNRKKRLTKRDKEVS